MNSRIAFGAVLLAGLVVAGAVVLAGGSGGGGGDCAGELERIAAAEHDLSAKPTVEVPDCDAPIELETVDLVEGDGKELASGDTARFHYVGVTFDAGTEFDSSWDRGEPFETAIGTGSVIPGWDEGIPGMKEGGRRLLIIPPEQAYGAAGSPPAIGPNETLVFVVDLEKVR
jgi:peptidylprolyl isomerase